MKKEYLILVLVIAGLCAYLATHNRNRTHYDLPELPPLTAGDITGVTLTHGDTTLTFSKENSIWRISDKAYPADEKKMESLLKTVTTLQVTALVSESGSNAQRYELDPANRITVTARGTSGILRTFAVGKTAPTYNHTFVRMDKDDRIYHAAGDFRRDVEVNIDDFRDKKILAFQPDAMNKTTIEMGDRIRSLSTRPAKATDDVPPLEKPSKDSGENTPNGDTKEKQTTGSAPSAEKPTWAFLDNGTAGNQEAMNQLLSTLSGLTCDAYTDVEDKNKMTGTPVCRITLSGKKEIRLTLFEKNGDNQYPGISSGSAYPFLLDSYTGDDIISRAKTLIGVSPEAAPDTAKE